MKNYQLGIYEKAMPNKLSLKEKLLFAKKIGYDYLELSIDETEEKLARLDWSDAEVGELRELLWDTGVPIGSICLSGHRKFPLGSLGNNISRRSLEIAEKAITFAANIGAPIIQLAGYDVYYEDSSKETISLFEENLKKVTNMAASKGVILAFETMETSFMNTVEKAMNYVSIVNSPYLQIYPDTGNITNAALDYGRDVIDDLKTGAGHIAALHLKESLPGKFREIPFATGHVPFAKLIGKAIEQGVRRYVTEFWYTGSPTWEEDVLFAFNHFARLLGEGPQEKPE